MAAKNNDPAFLFYSKDFYEGTRMMLPEERACYIDLMIYQHQHGYIPFDLKRVLMYCSGVSEATLEATLKAKFIASVEGYVNRKLEAVISERTDFTNKQSVNGTVGQFYKKAKALLSKKDYIELKELLSDNTNNQTLELIIGKEVNKAMLEAMLIALHKHLEDVNEDGDKDISKVKFDYSFIEEEMKTPFMDWLDYKKGKGKTYKTQKSLQACYLEMKSLSNNNPEIAVKIVNKSMANNWDGIFTLKQEKQNGRSGEVSARVGDNQGQTTL